MLFKTTIVVYTTYDPSYNDTRDPLDGIVEHLTNGNANDQHKIYIDEVDSNEISSDKVPWIPIGK